MQLDINITIEGTSPLICNRFTDAAQEKATNGTTGSIVGDRGSPKDQAAQKLYIGAEKKPTIPQPNLFRCLIDAGKYFKAGKSKVTTQKSSLIPACVAIDAIETVIESRDGWRVDTRPVRIPSTGGRILCHRPMFDDWRLSFILTVDLSMMTVKLMRDIVDAAGSRIGLGDFRPDCKGPYGRFVVVKWEHDPIPTEQDEDGDKEVTARPTTRKGKRQGLIKN